MSEDVKTNGDAAAADNTAVAPEEPAVENASDNQEGSPASELPPVEKEDGGTAPEGDEKPEEGSEEQDEHILNMEDEPPKGEKEEEGAPENYGDFTVPEGYALDGELKEAAVEMFRELNLSQEQAQKLVDYYVQRDLDNKAAFLSDLAAKQKSWREALRQRPNFATERAAAKKAMQKYITSPEEKALFKDTWLTDHPAMFTLFAKIGSSLREDAPPKGNSGAETISLNEARFPVK